MRIELLFVLVVTSTAYEKFDDDEVLLLFVEFLSFKDPGYFPLTPTGRSFALFFPIYWDLFCDGSFDHVGPSWAGGGCCIVVGLAASEFRLEADAFLLLGQCPRFFLLAEGELLLLPCFLAQAASLLSRPATVGPDMGIELSWSQFGDLTGCGDDGECNGWIIVVFVQKDGASAGES